ncbi:MAG: Na+/H+ antiporter subunit E [Oscillospiraceae bacterium]|jgi:multicomponent Na+:H+ antiporter subunit E|nr:Na+/H+ antiporter subunit E [Oscillospiraceae bacterium]
MFFLLLAFWLVLNARVTPETLILGVVLCGAVWAFAVKYLDYSPRAELRAAGWVFFLPVYGAVLIAEIVKANFAVLGLILRPGRRPDPVVVTFRPPLKRRVFQVLLANSITLTPGTITLTLEDGEFTVHCLDESLSHGLGNSVFVRLLARMEKRA